MNFSEQNNKDIGALQADMQNVKTDMAEMRGDMKTVLATLSEAKGYWKMLVLIAGAASGVTLFLQWLISWIPFLPKH